MSESTQLLATTYGAKVKIARTLRGLSQPDLVALSGVPVGSISSLETRQSKVANLDNLDKIATALLLPSVYFTSRNPRDYVMGRYYSLTEAQRRDLLVKPLHERLAWLVVELVALWPGVVSMETLAAKVPLLSPADLKLALAGDFSLSAEQLQALLAATGAPRELFEGLPAELPADISPETVRQYLNVIRLAASARVDPGALAAWVAQQMMSKITQNPAGR